jgi:hypothetical protein
LSNTCRQARSREIKLTPHSPHLGTKRAAFADTRGEDRKTTGDQTGRDGGSNAKDETETHVDLEEMRSDAIYYHPHQEWHWTRTEVIKNR